jgi:Metal-dependent hydrolases of the beta-lactamase superfamily I
LTHS